MGIPKLNAHMGPAHASTQRVIAREIASNRSLASKIVQLAERVSVNSH